MHPVMRLVCHPLGTLALVLFGTFASGSPVHGNSIGQAQLKPTIENALTDRVLALDHSTKDTLGQVEGFRYLVEDLNDVFLPKEDISFTVYIYNDDVAKGWIVDQYLIVLALQEGTTQVAVTASNDLGSMIDWFIVEVDSKPTQTRPDTNQQAPEFSFQVDSLTLDPDNTTNFVLPKVDDSRAMYSDGASLPAGLSVDLTSLRLTGQPQSNLHAEPSYWIAVDSHGRGAIQQFRIEPYDEVNSVTAWDVNPRGLLGVTDSWSTMGRFYAKPFAADQEILSFGVSVSMAPGLQHVVYSVREQLLFDVALAMRSAIPRPLWRDLNSIVNDESWHSWNHVGNYSSSSASNSEVERAGIYVGFDTSLNADASTGFSIGVRPGETALVRTTPLNHSSTFGDGVSSIVPYAYWQDSTGRQVWGVVGLGSSYLDRPRLNHGLVDQWDTGVLQGAVGWRHPLGTSGDITLATKGDARIAIPLSFLSTSNADFSPFSLASKSVSAGVEMEYTRGHLQPYIGVSGRLRSELADEVRGIETTGGLRYATGNGLFVEAEGRSLTLREAVENRLWGVSLAARLDPGTEGRGLAMTIQPNFGMNTQELNHRFGATVLDAVNVLPATLLDSRWSIQGALSYGLALSTSTTVTPFGQISVSTLNQTRMGFRLSSVRNVAKGFNLEVATISSRLQTEELLNRGIDVQLRLVF